MKRVRPAWTSTVTGRTIAEWEYESIGLADLTSEIARKEHARVTERLREDDSDRSDRAHKLIGTIESIATFYAYEPAERVERLRGALAAYNDLSDTEANA